MELLDQEFISKPSNESVIRLKALPPDVKRSLLDSSDWKTAASLCHIFVNVCRADYWQHRTENEFGKDYWREVYQIPFHNYLAARVRWLDNLPIVNRFWQSPPEIRSKMEDYNLISENLIFRIQNNPNKLETTILYSILKQIKNEEKERGYSSAEVDDMRTNVLFALREYFGIEPTFAQQKAAPVQQKEMMEISKFLASYLHRNYPETFKIDTFVAEIDSEEGNLDRLANGYIKKLRLKVDGLGLFYLQLDGKRYRSRLLFKDEFGQIGEFDLTDSSPLGFLTFSMRMRELGILPSFYSLLYPGFEDILKQYPFIT